MSEVVRLAYKKIISQFRCRSSRRRQSAEGRKRRNQVCGGRAQIRFSLRDSDETFEMEPIINCRS